MNWIICFFCFSVLFLTSSQRLDAQLNLGKEKKKEVVINDLNVHAEKLKFPEWIQYLDEISDDVIINTEIHNTWLSIRKVQGDEIVVFSRAGAKIGHTLVMLNDLGDSLNQAKREGDAPAYSIKLNGKDLVFAYAVKLDERRSKIRIVLNHGNDIVECSLNSDA